MNTKEKDLLRRKYDNEFKRQALQMIANGQAVRSVAQSLGVGENLLHKRKQAAHAHQSPDEREVAQLRIRLRQVEQERDILKNVWLRRRSQLQNESYRRKVGRMQQMSPSRKSRSRACSSAPKDTAWRPRRRIRVWSSGFLPAKRNDSVKKPDCAAFTIAQSGA